MNQALSTETTHWSYSVENLACIDENTNAQTKENNEYICD